MCSKTKTAPHRFAYKKPGKGRIKIVTLYAVSEEAALRFSAEVIDGYQRYGYLGASR